MAYYNSGGGAAPNTSGGNVVGLAVQDTIRIFIRNFCSIKKL